MMPSSVWGTAAAACSVGAVLLAPATLANQLQPLEGVGRLPHKVVSRSFERRFVESFPGPTVIGSLLEDERLCVDQHVDRQTTDRERLIGEIRSWTQFAENWDGEGAAAPDRKSIKEAVEFIRLLSNSSSLPEPMLHASGHAGLFWHDPELYADIEFLGDSRVAYYIERHGDKNKGVVKFDSDSKKMPPLFPLLLWGEEIISA